MDLFKNPRASPPPPSPPVPTLSTKPDHPFYPVEIEIANFVANDMTVIQLLANFATGCSVILAVTWLLTSGMAPRLKATDKLAALWFCLCATCKMPGSRTPTLTLNRWLHTPLFRGLLLLQPHPYGRPARSVWTTLEGVRVVGFKIPDV